MYDVDDDFHAAGVDRIEPVDPRPTAPTLFSILLVIVSLGVAVFLVWIVNVTWALELLAVVSRFGTAILGFLVGRWVFLRLDKLLLTLVIPFWAKLTVAIIIGFAVMVTAFELLESHKFVREFPPTRPRTETTRSRVFISPFLRHAHANLSCCRGLTMFWPFKSRSPAQPCFAIGQYRIGANVDDQAGFRPFSSEELALLNPEMTFEGEQILHAPDAIFMDSQWNTVLGVVHGEIYKISIQWTGPRHEVGAIERQIKVQCTKRYGKGENMTVWDASDGNIIVDGDNFGSEAILTVTVTAQKVRQFKRV